MSDEGEKTCPLCAEEMDLTDQQLRPCKCGYDICVWCWHHIMDMAEKDDTEGRCPACRTSYNKEKIVGMTSKCERLVAEMGVDKKQKSQKGKNKTSEGRKHLSSVRVIQRNLVYIVGLPLNLADEDLLQRKDYFGQYGKVLKVSISRTAAGAIQHFPNNTCSVYITYSKEDEAVRSIQSVHGFILEGRPLRACFGTTKYCHAWLRSMPCTNPDCLYLHEFGSQEDSFSKDEIISEYTRGRVQQVNGALNDMQRRSGSILPPAADDYSNNSISSWGKPITKSTTNDPGNSMKGSPPNSSSGRSVALPAAASWGTHASNSQPIAANVTTSNGPPKQKVDTCPTPSFSTSPSSHANEILKKETPIVDQKGKLELPESSQQLTTKLPDVSNEETIHQLSSDMSSLSIGTNHELQPYDHDDDDEKLLEPSASNLQNKVNEVEISEAEADLLSFNNQRLTDQEIVTHIHTGYVHNMPRISPNTSNNTNQTDHNTALDLGENSIISNILSMDFDPWDESLTSPQNLAKLLGDRGDKNGSTRVSGSRKTQNCNQSRFSFAREDDGCIDQGSSFTRNTSDFGNGLDVRNFDRDFFGGQISNGNCNGNGFSSFNFEESDRFATNHSSMSSNKISVARSQISAPPGFTGPSREPPPGFTSNERMEQTYDNQSGNHMFDTSSLLRKSHQPPPPLYTSNISDLEFMDPAILAVGGRVPNGPTNPGLLDTRSNFPSHLNSYETDNNNRLRLLMQRSFTHQHQRFINPDHLPDNLSFPRRTDSYGVSPRTLEQQQQQALLLNNRHVYQQQQQQHGNFHHPRMSNNNGYFDGWNEVQNNGNDIAMAEILRNERLGFNKYYSGYEDTTKFRLPSSGDVYSNRTFGI